MYINSKTWITSIHNTFYFTTCGYLLASICCDRHKSSGDCKECNSVVVVFVSCCCFIFIYFLLLLGFFFVCLLLFFVFVFVFLGSQSNLYLLFLLHIIIYAGTTKCGYSQELFRCLPRYLKLLCSSNILNRCVFTDCNRSPWRWRCQSCQCGPSRSCLHREDGHLCKHWGKSSTDQVKRIGMNYSLWRQIISELCVQILL